MILVVIEHDRGAVADATFEAFAAARPLAAELGVELHALSLGTDASAEAAAHGAVVTHVVSHELLADYGPEAWGDALAQVVGALSPTAVVATGTDRGSEVLAQCAARLDLPMVANCNVITSGSPWKVVRTRWGGSLLEEAAVEASTYLLTTTHHAFNGSESPVAGRSEARSVTLDPSLARSMVRDRVVREAGVVTLGSARVVVSGGRGVGSAEAFAPLEELAALLGGVVGCSRAVTNNGWRNHTDQVGQTGTRIAPEIYIACGVSGAIQHWVGAMASKNILAINTDPEANMVSKAGHAVIGDLHKVVPAISAEIKRRRGA